MSTSVDNKIVQMTFDNEQFEKETRVTMKTLDRLRDSLDLTESAKGFDSISTAIRRVDVSPLSKGIDQINVSFKALDAVAFTVLNRITNQVLDMGKNLVKSLSLDQITDGFRKYEDYTSSVQTIIAATGKSVEEVESYMDRLNTFTDETSYRLTDMTNNIGKFTSNNVDLETAVIAMQGIASASALAGAKIPDASHAMEGFSKAIAKGHMDLLNWKWIETARMATAGFKDSLIQAALAEGTLIKKNGEFVTANKETVVSVENFNETLKDKWITKNVMLRTLEQYGMFADRIVQIADMTDNTVTSLLDVLEDYGKAGFNLDRAAAELGLSIGETKDILEELGSEEMKLGQQAFRAAQEAKTFHEAIDAVKDAVSTGWMKTFKIIFGNYDEAKKLWTDLAEGLYEVFAESGEARNKLLSDWKSMGGRNVLIAAFYEIANQLNTIRLAFKDAITAIFPPMTVERLITITNIFAAFVKSVALSEDAVSGLTKLLTLLLSPLKLVSYALQGIMILGGAAFYGISRLLNGVFEALNDIESVADNIVEFFGADRFERLSNAIGVLLGKLGSLIGVLVKFGTTVKDNVVNVLRSINFSGFGIKEKVLDAIVNFFEAISNFKMPDVFGLIQKALDGVRNAVQPLSGVFNTILSPITRITTLFERAGKKFEETGERANRFKTIIDNLKDTLKGFVGIKVPALFGGIGSAAGGGATNEKALTGFTLAVKKSEELKDNMEKTSVFAKVVQGLFSVVGGIGAKVAGAATAIRNFVVGGGIITTFNNFTKALREFGTELVKVRDKVVDFVSKIDPMQVLMFSLAATIVYTVKQMGDMFRKVGGLTVTVKQVISTIAGITAPGRGASFVIDSLSRMIITMVVAIASVSFVMNKYGDDMKDGVIVLGTLAAFVTALSIGAAAAVKHLGLIKALESVGKALSGMSSSLLASSVSLLIIIKLLKEMEEGLDFKTAWKNLGLLTAIATGLVVFGGIMAKIGFIPTLRSSVGLISFALALRGIVGILSTIKPEVYDKIGKALEIAGEKIGAGLATLTDYLKKCDFKTSMTAAVYGTMFFGTFAAFLGALGFALSKVTVGFATSLLIMAGAIRLVSKLPWGDFMTAITNVGRYINAGINVFIDYITSLNENDSWRVVTILTTFTGALVIGGSILLGVAEKVANIGKGLAVAFLGFSASLFVVLGFIKAIAKTPQTDIDKATGVLKSFGIFAAVISGIGAFGKHGGKGMLQAAAAISLLSITLYPLMDVMKRLSELIALDENGTLAKAREVMLEFAIVFTAMTILGRFGGKFSGKNLLGMSAFVLSVGIVITMLSYMIEDIKKAGEASFYLFIVVSGLAAAAALIGSYGGLAGGGAFLMMAAGLAAITITLVEFSTWYNANGQLFLEGLMAIALAVGGLSLGLMALGNPTVLAALGLGAAAILGLSLVIAGIDFILQPFVEHLKNFITFLSNAFFGAMNTFQQLDLPGLAAGIGLLSLSFVGLAGAATVVAFCAPSMFVAAAAIYAIGKATEAAANGVETFGGILSKTAEIIFSVADRVVEKLKEIKAAFESLGGSMSEGVVAGMGDAAQKILRKNAAIDLIWSIYDIAAGPKGADAHSPSKLFMVLGQFISQGLCHGLVASPEEFATAAENIVNTLFSKIKAAAGAIKGGWNWLLEAFGQNPTTRLLDKDFVEAHPDVIMSTEEANRAAEQTANLMKDVMVGSIANNKETIERAATDTFVESLGNGITNAGSDGTLSRIAEGAIGGVLKQGVTNGANQDLDETVKGALGGAITQGSIEAGRIAGGAAVDAGVAAANAALSNNASAIGDRYLIENELGAKMIVSAEELGNMSGYKIIEKLGDSADKEARTRSSVFSSIMDFIIRSFTHGATDLQGVEKAAGTIADAFENKFRDETEVHSESPKYFGIGKWVPESFINGAYSMLDSAAQSAHDLADAWGLPFLNDLAAYAEQAKNLVGSLWSEGVEYGAKKGYFTDEFGLPVVPKSDPSLYESIDDYNDAWRRYKEAWGTVYADSEDMEGQYTEVERRFQQMNFEFLQNRAAARNAKSGGGGGGSSSTKKIVAQEIKPLDELVKAYERDTGAIKVMVENYRDSLKKNLGPGVQIQIDEKKAVLGAAAAVDKFAVSLYEAKDPANKLEYQQKVLAEAIAYMKGETKEASEAAKELAKQTTEGASAEQRAWEATQIVVTKSISGINQAVQEYKKNIADVVKANHGMFDVLQKTEEINGEQLHENIKGNNDHIDEWISGMEQLGTMKDNGVLVATDELMKYLEELGPTTKGMEILYGLLDMDLERFYETQEEFLEGLGKGDEVANRMYAMWSERGQDLTEEYLNGVNDEEGIESGVVKFAETLVSTCDAALPEDKLYPNGKHLTLGLAKGMLDSEAIDALDNAVDEICSRLEFRTEKDLEMNSPSKLFARIGAFLDLGLAKGIKDNVHEPVSAISNLTSSISSFGRRIAGEFDVNPTITPTLDLSRVAEGARGISRMFNQNRGINVLEDEDALNNSKSGASYTFIQNNNSPKALSRIDIYRQTKNQFAYFKEVAGGI